MKEFRRLTFVELMRGCALPADALSLRALVSALPQDNEVEIVRYLEEAPNYSAMGKIVGDVLNPNENVALFPGTNTDGIYFWPTDLAYYVRKYHVRLPRDFIERMAACGWKPPTKDAIDWDEIRSFFAPKP